jgi:FtsH-binding integral membrane protein
MSYAYEYQPLAIRADESARAAFIRRTYGHLAGAILAFVALEWALFQLADIENIVRHMLQGYTWLIVVVAFVGVGHLADLWARSNVSRGLQYMGLGIYVVAEAVVFLPLMYIAAFYTDRSVIANAGILTLMLFGGLTVGGFVTRKDFSYLRPILSIASFLAIGMVTAYLFTGGATFGLVIAFFMVAFASVAIMYNTSNVIHHYRTDQHVAASLALFSSVATLFYYILWILVSADRR